MRFVVPPLGPLGCVCLEGGVTNTHGDHAVALRGIILVRPVAQVRSPNFYQSTANFVKHWRNQQQVRCGLDGGFAAAGSKIPIIFITAHDHKESRQQALQAGAIAFLGKPFNDELLLKAIRAAWRQNEGSAKTT